MKPIFTLLATTWFIGAVAAEELKKYDRLLDYENVTVRKVEKDGISIFHKNGAVKIPIEELPEDIRNELGMSMDGVEAYREKTAEREREAAHARAQAARKARIVELNKELLKETYLRIERATVFQVVDGGVLAHVSLTSDGTFREVPTYKTVRVGSALSGYKNQKVKSGSKKVKNTSFHDDWLIFISCDNSKFVDGSAFAGDVWAAGRYSYTTALGGGKTIPKYTADPDDVTKR